MVYVMSIHANVMFDVEARSEEEAMEKGREFVAAHPEGEHHDARQAQAGGWWSI